jgi:molybdopterin-containing oxidoreductase family membrane subunit
VTVDIGRPDRFWHLVPLLGRFNWPSSMLSWDVIVLNGYLVLNLGITTYLLFRKFCGRKPERRKYVPFVFVAIVWAFSIHTVTAFLYSGMESRPHWNAAILAPRFLASAFAAGPSLMILALSIIRDRMGFPVSDAALDRLRQIVAVTMLINLFFFFSEIFTELYSFKHHAASMRYLLFGLHGHTTLVPYIWTAIALDVFAAAVFMTRALHRRPRLFQAGCVAAVVGVWVEKGMGLVIPGFVPSPLGEIVDYTPSFTEFCVSAGIWAAGALLYTLLLKAAVPIEVGTLRIEEREAAS